jgi:microcystin-dependent protein
LEKTLTHICVAFAAQALKEINMSDTVLGEIKLFAGNIEPPGWLFCDGRLLRISDHMALFEVVGNSFGGDGLTTFGIPDLRGRVPMGQGAGAGLTNRNLGDEPGAETVIMDVTQLPSHDHTLRATNSAATQTQPAGNILATAATPQYLNASTSVGMGSDSIGATGSDAPHANVQPSSVLSFLIAIAGRSPRDAIRIVRGVSDTTRPF